MPGYQHWKVAVKVLSSTRVRTYFVYTQGNAMRVVSELSIAQPCSVVDEDGAAWIVASCAIKQPGQRMIWNIDVSRNSLQQLTALGPARMLNDHTGSIHSIEKVEADVKSDIGSFSCVSNRNSMDILYAYACKG